MFIRAVGGVPVSLYDVTALGLKEVHRTVANLNKQMRFASALACTRMAQAVQKGLLVETRERFHIRGSWLKGGGRFGIAYDQARKNDPVIQSRVYNRAPWMNMHEEGGIKTPKGKKIAVPIEGGPRRRVEAKILSARRPGAIMTAGGFILNTKKGPVIFVRKRKKARAVPWYGLEKSVKIRAAWGFVKTGQRIVAMNWERAFGDAVARALGTAR